jgi:hypothetical protein
MAIRDAGTMFSQAQAITALSQVSSFWIDFFDPAHQIGQAVKPPLLHVGVNTTFTGAAFNFLTLAFQDAGQAAGSTGPNAIPGVFETVFSLPPIPKAALVAGTDLLIIPVPMTGGVIGITQQGTRPDSFSGSPLQRYIQFLYTVDGIPATGAIDAWLENM